MGKKHTKSRAVEFVPIPVCWSDSDGNISWGHATSAEMVNERRAVVRFADGGWNWADDCFFTEEQCRRFHDLPPKKWKDQRREISIVLKEMSEAFSP